MSQGHEQAQGDTVGLAAADPVLRRTIAAQKPAQSERPSDATATQIPPKHRRRGSLASRLIVGALAWILIVLAAAGWGLSSLYRDSVTRALDAEIEVVLQTLVAALGSDPDGTIVVAEGDLPNDPRFARVLSGRYWAIAPSESYGNPRDAYRSRSLWDGALPWPTDRVQSLTANPGLIQTLETTGPNEERLRVAAQAILLPDRPEPVLLIAGADKRDAEASYHRFAASLSAALALLAFGLFVAMVIQVRVGLAPLTRISTDIADIRAGRLARISEDYPVEVAPLTVEVNQLLEHNRQVVDRARTHVGNLAHALKTPIAVLMNEAKGSTEFAELVRRQTESMSRNVQHYLKRAQAAASGQVLGARVEVKSVADDLARMLTRLYRNKGVEITVSGSAEAAFRGERQDLEEMLGNLMENACKWCIEEIFVRVESDTQTVTITVEDDGPGLSPEARVIAMQRGMRLDETTPGTGLGLSIVTDLSQDYGGSFRLDASEAGGLKAVLSLPAALA